MAPDITRAPTGVGVLFENDSLEQTPKDSAETISSRQHYHLQIVWRNVLQFSILHAAALYGLYLMLTSANIVTSIYAILLYLASMLGITAGAHRLWTHRSYKARWPLRVFLMALNTLAFQNSVLVWVRDHRMHHKYSDTDADPHNARRGFFFSHVGWLMARKHPEVKAKGSCIDMRDLEDDPVVMFQKRHIVVLGLFGCFIIPTAVPMYFWGETFLNAWFVATMFRYTLTLNLTWLVNSAAHIWGNKPYDQHIIPTQNLSVTLGTLGEGWHNYHHVFPWDYRAAELGHYGFNLTTAFIDLCALVGVAYDLKTVPPTLIQKRVERTGDGSHDIWGWGDKDMSQDEIDEAAILHGKAY